PPACPAAGAPAGGRSRRSRRRPTATGRTGTATARPRPASTGGPAGTAPPPDPPPRRRWSRRSCADTPGTRPRRATSTSRTPTGTGPGPHCRPPPASAHAGTTAKRRERRRPRWPAQDAPSGGTARDPDSALVPQVHTAPLERPRWTEPRAPAPARRPGERGTRTRGHQPTCSSGADGLVRDLNRQLIS